MRGRLDTGRVAVTGHSLGGAAALQAAARDRGFAAAVDIDGFPHGPAPRAIRQPVLALTHDVDQHSDPEYIDRLTKTLDVSRATSYRLTVPGSAHVTFTDAPLYLPPVPAVVGTQDRTEGPRITAATTLAFLDPILRAKSGSPADALSRYGGLTVHRPDAAR
ncbi:alpha/beta fold hydrolase [Streptomyces sp. NPDC047108]|uniref:alpha/beta fold hydrolase n=1 Tax=Streptomyces sp. NPDC047108 TaxID=3155025 RepID=UPI0033C109B8